MLISSTQFVFIQFISDSVVNWQGFYLNFRYQSPNIDSTQAPLVNRTICGETKHINLPQGQSVPLFSPGYFARGYENNMHCTWVVTSQSRLELSDIKIELSNDGDFVAIYDESSGNSPLLTMLSGTIYPSTIFPNSTTIFIEFSTEGFGLLANSML